MSLFSRLFSPRSATKSHSRSATEEDPLLGAEAGVSGEVINSTVEDKFYLVYWTFFLQGAAMLLPWNVFITASEFFLLKFTGSSYENTFQNYFSTYFTASNLVFFALALWRQKQANISLRIYLPLVINMAIFAVLSASAGGNMVWSSTTYFYSIMALIVITGATTAYLQIGVFAVASLFPSVYMQAVMSGQGLAGAAVSIASIVSSLASTSLGSSSPRSDSVIEHSAFLYFLTATLFTTASLLAQGFLVRHPFYLRYASRTVTEDGDLGANDRSLDIPEESSSVSVLSVLLKIRYTVLAVALAFMITLSVFPSITMLIKSVQAHPPSNETGISIPRILRDDLFVSLHFLLFNLGDWAGKSLPALPGFLITSSQTLLSMSLLRIVFVPLFIICNVVAPDRSMPTWIRTDTGYWAVLLLFALTGGYIGSLCMIAAPLDRRIKGGREKEMVGSVMSFSLVLGLAIGGSGSFLVRRWI